MYRRTNEQAWDELKRYDLADFTLQASTIIVEPVIILTKSTETFAISRVFRPFAKVNPREIALYPLAREMSSKISQNLHENKEKVSKFVAFAKVYTRET